MAARRQQSNAARPAGRRPRHSATAGAAPLPAAEAIVEAAASILETRSVQLQQIERSRMARWFFGALFLALLALIGVMTLPYVHAVVIGLIVAGAFYPMLDWLLRRLRFGRQGAALAATLVVVLAVFLPLGYVAGQLVVEAAALYDRANELLSAERVRELLFGRGWFPDAARRIFSYFNMDYTPHRMEALLLDLLRTATSEAVSRVNSLLGNLVDLVVQIAVMLVVIYGMFRHGPNLKRFLLELSPLPEEESELLIQRFNQMNYVTMAGNGIGGILQGGLAGFAFWFLGFESALLWTVIMSILAFLPLIGMSIVYIPASIYLLALGRYGEGIFLFLFCSAVSLIVENWFKPIFVGASVEINSVVVLLSIVGGLSAFGPVGIFYGPLIISLFMTIVNLYHARYASVYNQRR